MSGKLKALIFDVDGTLAETEEAHRQAFNTAFARAGRNWHWTPLVYRDLLRVAGGKERIAHWCERQNIRLSARDIAELHSVKTRAYADLLANGLPLRRGVKRLINEALEADLLLAIATTTTPANIDALLVPHFGDDWRQRFQSIKAGNSVAHKKPARDVYMAALDELGIDRSEAIAFEDSRIGVASANAAGIAVVATPSHFWNEDDFSGADLVLEDFGEHDAGWRDQHEQFTARFLDLPGLQAWHQRRQPSRPTGTAP